MRRKVVIFMSIFLLLIVGLKIEMTSHIYHNDILALKYPIKGIDVSHHQVRINWKKVNKEKYQFVFMKATEGKDFLDSDFAYNWTNAQLNGMKVGAYHFFSMLSSGSEQADFYISKVPYSEHALPPVIDVEIPTKYDKRIVHRELQNLVNKLEKRYKKRVIFYVNSKTYNAYIKDTFPNNQIWYTDVKFYPMLKEKDRWVIWQYSTRGKVLGIAGKTDKNVLRYKTLEELVEKNKIKDHELN